MKEKLQAFRDMLLEKVPHKNYSAAQKAAMTKRAAVAACIVGALLAVLLVVALFPITNVEIKTNGDIYVNGVLEDGTALGYDVYTDGIIKYPTAQSLTVPEGHVFLAGDHRNVSLDSRSFGVVDVRWIQGKALFRIFPLEGFGPV